MSVTLAIGEGGRDRLQQPGLVRLLKPLRHGRVFRLATLARECRLLPGRSGFRRKPAGQRMNEYLGFLIVPDPFVYRQPARFSVFRPERSGAVLIHQGVVKARFRTEEGAMAAVLAAGRAYIDSLSKSD